MSCPALPLKSRTEKGEEEEKPDLVSTFPGFASEVSLSILRAIEV
jgi:hypothetical protein